MGIENVSDTALWVAMYRAQESERPDALFHDPFARRLAGKRGEELLASIPKARRFGWPMVVRTAVMDEILLRQISSHGIDLVVNLAAGLDTRPYRLDLPAELQWVEVDLPAISEYKSAALNDERPICHLDRVALDLRDAEGRRDLFQRLGEASQRALVISEGLLIYLDREDVAALARDLHAPPSLHSWVIDLASPWLLQWMEKSWGKAVASGGAPFKFAPEEGTAFFAPCGWQEVEYRSNMDEAHRLRREMRLAPLWRFLGRFSPPAKRERMRRISGVVRLERR